MIWIVQILMTIRQLVDGAWSRRRGFRLPDQIPWYNKANLNLSLPSKVLFFHFFSGDGDAENPIVKLQIKEFKENIRQDGSDKRWWDFKYVPLSHQLFIVVLRLELSGLLSVSISNGLFLHLYILIYSLQLPKMPDGGP